VPAVTDENLRAALVYARAGWRVFPIIPGEKVPATSHGVKDATSDPGQIRAWWERNPDRNVAVACGYPGPDVLDIDRKPDGASGFPALRRLREAGMIGNPRAMIRTPNDGAHLYFAPTPGSGNGSVAAAHIDHRGEGGYIVAPPSQVRRAADGQLRPYVVVRHQASAERINWAAIREFLDPQPQRAWEPRAHLRDGGRQNLDHLVGHMAGLDDGRKRYLYWAANRVLDHGQPGRLDDLAAAARQAGVDGRVIERTIRSAQATARQDPHAGAYPRGGPVRLSKPEPATRPAAARHEREAEPPRARTAVLEADRDGPQAEAERESQDQPAPEPEHQPERAAGEPREPAPASEAEHEEPARPFAEPEPEREAGE
jgi:hypothetical protein